MRASEFQDIAPGSLVDTIHGADAFLPDQLPPEIDQGPLVDEVYEAGIALGKLQGLGPEAGDPSLLRDPFIRKEAVQSSQIEGNPVTLSDIYAYEAGHESIVEDRKRQELPEAFNLVQTMEYALESGTDGLTVDFVCELNRRLLEGVRGEEDPGELRTLQNWIGVTRDIHDAQFVPPPPEHVEPLLRRLLEFVNGERHYLTLVDVALVHYQFETIHPSGTGTAGAGGCCSPPS